MKKNEILVASVLGIITLSAAVLGFVKREFFRTKIRHARNRLCKRHSVPDPDALIDDPAPTHSDATATSAGPAPDPDGVIHSDTTQTEEDTIATSAGPAPDPDDVIHSDTTQTEEDTIATSAGSDDAPKSSDDPASANPPVTEAPASAPTDAPAPKKKSASKKKFGKEDMTVLTKPSKKNDDDRPSSFPHSVCG